ncbi:MAG: hypothetical protein WC967_13740 [Balneolaceae bacterium]
MKKINLLLLSFLLIPALTMAQYPGKGTIDINGGIGVGHNLSGTGGIPINISVDYGYDDNFTYGGYLGYLGSSTNTGWGTWKYTNFILGARGTYHHQLAEDFDTYGGLILGYNVATVKWDGPGTNRSSAGGMVAQPFVGGRYHFNENVGAYAELGFGIAILQFGVTYRM